MKARLARHLPAALHLAGGAALLGAALLFACAIGFGIAARATEPSWNLPSSSASVTAAIASEHRANGKAAHARSCRQGALAALVLGLPLSMAGFATSSRRRSA